MSLEATAYQERSDRIFRVDARGARSYRISTPRFITLVSGPLAPDADAPTVLETCLDELERGGTRAFARLPGNFAVVVCDRQSRVLWAARDVFGAVPLYYQQLPDRLMIATDLDRFGVDDFDREFIAEFIATGGASLTRTVRPGVFPVPAAHALVWKNGQVSFERYWSLDDHRPTSSADPDDLAQEFRRLLECALHRCTTPAHGTWSHLSGGLDSSSVVCLVGDRLGGTVSFVESLGNGDETKFSDLVVERVGVPNVKVTDYWPWRSDGQPIPITDQPTRDFPYYARDRFVADTITGGGGSSLLSGIGPDQLLAPAGPTPRDLLRRGRLWGAERELLDLANARQQSIVRTIWHEVVIPSSPRRIRHALVRNDEGAPDWFNSGFTKEFDVHAQLAGFVAERSSRTANCRGVITRGLQRMSAMVPAWCSQFGIDVYHPYLDRPLLEFCLRIPEQFRDQRLPSKWLLREAMRNRLPEQIRTRTTKGIIAPRFAWAFRHERPFLDRLLDEPILGELGCIEPRKVRASLDLWAIGRAIPQLFLYTALSLETWLSARSSRCLISSRQPREEQINEAESDEVAGRPQVVHEATDR